MASANYYYIIALVLYCSIIASMQFPIMDKEKASMYLEKYGYLEQKSDTHQSISLVGLRNISRALLQFQKFVGISETGVLDNKTISMMNKRCGVKDILRVPFSNRKKRFALKRSRWGKTTLTYRISKYPTSLKDKVKVDKVMEKALKLWSSVTPLAFRESKRGRVDIDIRFERGDHGDVQPFDGPGDFLAHAFPPKDGGDVHFDDDEKWSLTDSTEGSTNLLEIAAHEFGHSLGLDHTDDTESIMTAYDRGFVSPFQLSEDDINGIQHLYGPVGGNAPLSEAERNLGPSLDTSDAADICQDGTIDAITRTEDGNTYVFKGDFYWKMSINGTEDGYPRRISQDWNNLEGNLDAAMTWSNNKTYFFKGRRFWRFTNREMDSGYPRLLEVGFEGIPENVDAAFVWSGNSKTYFFKGDSYWRYDDTTDPPVSDKYPKLISQWNGIPNNIDAALQWEKRRTYFFKDNKYYRFNDAAFRIDNGTPSYPRSTSIWWFDCKPTS